MTTECSPKNSFIRCLGCPRSVQGLQHKHFIPSWRLLCKKPIFYLTHSILINSHISSPFPYREERFSIHRTRSSTRNHFLKLSRAPTRHRVFHRNDSYRLACFSTESVRSSSDSNRRFGGGLLSSGTGLHQIGRAFLLVLFFCTSKRKEGTAIFRTFNSSKTFNAAQKVNCNCIFKYPFFTDH